MLKWYTPSSPMVFKLKKLRYQNFPINLLEYAKNMIVTLLAGWILPYLISSMLLLTETFSLSNVEKSVFLPKLAKTNFPYVQKKRKATHCQLKIHKT